MLKDAEARDRIIDDLDTTFLVEAGAGSGKTTSLVNRMVSLVKSGKADIQQIAAITFTRKASSELKSRFQVALEKAVKECIVEEERTRLENGLANMNLCFMGTIHSFCGRLLRERPLEARLDPGFHEMEEDEDTEFRNRCWDDYLMDLQVRGDLDELNVLKTMGINVEDLRTVYHNVSAYPDVTIAMVDVERPDFDRVRNSLFAMIDRALNYIPTYEPDGDWDSLQKAFLDTKRQRAYKDFTDDLELIRLLETNFDKSLKVTQNRWTDKPFAKDMIEEYADWRNGVFLPFMRQWKEYKYPHVIRFVQPAALYCRKRRQELGALNFQDLLMKATEMLRDSEEVRRYFKQRYTRLFVDEFQDTDPIQAEMMFLLSGTDVTESNWMKIVPEAGSLFIVGDPKQSIYRFRRADIATYNFVKGRIAEHGQVLELNVNFRSVDAIGHFVNSHFQTCFPDVETVQQAKFVPLATRMENPKTTFGVHTLTYPKSLSNKENVATADAERIASWIRWACNGNVDIHTYDAEGHITGQRPVQPGDFMILTWGKALLHLYGQSLEERGIPSQVVDSQETYVELHDLAMLAECLADPTDKVALLAVLRGIFFGISDNCLYHYKREGHSFSLFHLPETDEVSEVARPVREALQVLFSYYQWTREYTALSAFEQILLDTGYIPYTAVQQGGTLRGGMITSLLQYLHGQLVGASNWTHLANVLLELDNHGTFGSSSLYPGRTQVVRIMNLHKAKGLEAPIVFLACPCGFTDHDATNHVDRSEADSKGYFSVTKTEGFKRVVLAQPKDWETWAAKERTFLTAERNRLLYVATTRARQMLIVSQWEDTAAKDPWSPLQGILEHVPELEDVNVEVAPRPVYSGIVDVERYAAEMNERIESLTRPTWGRTSVTTEVKANVIQPERHVHGLGATYGTVVHRCIEALGNGLQSERLRSMAVIAAEEAGLREEHIDSVMDSVEAVIASDVWERSLNAKRRLFEVPFVLMQSASGVTHSAESAAGLDISTGSHETTGGNLNVQAIIMHGVVDMLFEEEDGWVIVDFKTDAFELEQEAEFTELYRAQVAMYAQVWQETFGYQVKEAGLYFTGHQHFTSVL